MSSVSFFRQNLRHVLKDHGSQTALAEAAGLTKSYITRILKDEEDPDSQCPTIAVACAIANALSIPLGDLTDTLPKNFKRTYQHRGKTFR